MVTDLCDSCQFFYDCKIRKHQEINGKRVNSCNSYKNVSELPYKSLTDVHNSFTKWFPNLNTTRIDTRLAHYFSNEYVLGNPLWMFEISRSGFLKTTLTNSFSKSPKIIEIDQLTPKALISGKEIKGKPVEDLGLKFENRNRIGIINESAYLKALQSGEKKELFAVIKKWHDGKIQRHTGSGINKTYNNCNTSLWFNSTPDFHKDTIIHQEIGTCLLIDIIPFNTKNDLEDSKRAMDYRNKLEEIKKETQTAVNCYLAHHHLKPMELDDDEKLFITREANRLKYLRTTGSYDNVSELTYSPEPEFPARVSIQLAKMYECLLSLDDNYPKERAKKIIERITDGTGDQVMIKVLDYVDVKYNLFITKGENDFFSVAEVVSNVDLGTGTVKKRLELLTNFGFLYKEYFKSDSKGRPGFRYRLNAKTISPGKWQELFRREVLTGIEYDDSFVL